MTASYLIVTVLAAVVNIYAATNDFRRVAWVVSSMKRLGISERWLATLGILKTLGAVGLLIGIRIQVIGLAAAAGLVLFFLAAILTALRARWYAHLPYPAVWLGLAVAALVLRLAAV
jgi:hypothetical protein